MRRRGCQTPQPAVLLLTGIILSQAPACGELDFPAECGYEDSSCPSGYVCNIDMCVRPYSVGMGQPCIDPEVCVVPLTCRVTSDHSLTPDQESMLYGDEASLDIHWPKLCGPNGEEGQNCFNRNEWEFGVDCGIGLGCVSHSPSEPFRCMPPGPNGAFCEPDCSGQCFGDDCYPIGTVLYGACDSEPVPVGCR